MIFRLLEDCEHGLKDGPLLHHVLIEGERDTRIM